MNSNRFEDSPKSLVWYIGIIVCCLLSALCRADIFTTGQVTNEDNTVQWNWTTATPTYSDWVVIGYGNSGIIQLDNTFDGNGIQSFQCYHLVLGSQANADGSLVISGAGATLKQPNAGSTATSIYIGNGDNSIASFTLQNGATVIQPSYENHHIYIANGVGSEAVMTLKDAGTRFVLSDVLYVGMRDGCTGELTIKNGATFHAALQYIGYYSGSYGKIVIDGPASQMTTGDSTQVGRNGTGEIVITNGGYFYTKNHVYLGTYDGSDGIVEVTDDGSLWYAGHSFFIGNGNSSTPSIPATGFLKIARGGKIEAVQYMYVGNSSCQAVGTLDFIIGGTGAGTVNCGLIETSNLQLRNAELAIHVDPGVNLTIGTQYTLADYGTLGTGRFIGISDGDIYTSDEGYHFQIDYDTDLGGGDLGITATVVEIPPCVVDDVDLYLLISHWMDTGCEGPDWCGGADLDFSTSVDLGDLSQIALFWLDSCPVVWPWQ